MHELAKASVSEETFERLRDILVITSRRMTKEQVLQLSDDLHTVLRRRGERTWQSARRGTAGFS